MKVGKTGYPNLVIFLELEPPWYHKLDLSLTRGHPQKTEKKRQRISVRNCVLFPKKLIVKSLHEASKNVNELNKLNKARLNKRTRDFIGPTIATPMQITLIVYIRLLKKFFQKVRLKNTHKKKPSHSWTMALMF